MTDLEWLLFAAVGVAVLLALLRAGARKRHRPARPYRRRESLLTAGELRFYRTLRAAVPDGLTLFVKVRLMDVVTVVDADWQKYGAPGSGMHVDFVLADADLRPCLVVELDDRSHLRPEVKERDAFKDAALAAAGVPVLRVAAAGRYELGELRARIGMALSAG